MSEPKFTPGPWKHEVVQTSCGTCHKIGPFPSAHEGDEGYACVYADNIQFHDYGHNSVGDELKANAVLMCAAPDLLVALKRLLPMAELGAASPVHDGFCGPEQSCDCTCMAAYHDSKALEKARTAIANAEGHNDQPDAQ